MTVITQAVWIGKMGVCKPQGLCFFVHFLAKGLYTSRTNDGKSRGRIVGGGQQQGIEQLLHGQNLALVQIDRRALNADCLGRDADFLVKRE